MGNPEKPGLTRREFLLREKPPELHIASCVVQLRPERMQHARPAIESVIGWPVTVSDPKGKLVVILEGPHTSALLAQMERIRAIPGVLTIEMAYQHAEDASAMNEEMQ